MILFTIRIENREANPYMFSFVLDEALQPPRLVTTIPSTAKKSNVPVTVKPDLTKIIEALQKGNIEEAKKIAETEGYTVHITDLPTRRNS